MRLQGKRALVTGAGKGIGPAIAVALAAEGAAVACHYNRSREGAETTAERIRDAGGQAVILGADLTDHQAVLGLADEALGTLGGVDLLVNNAGLDPGDTVLLECSEELYDQVLGVNLKAAFFLTQRIARALVAAGRGGAVVNISSIHGHLTKPLRSPYAVTKGGMDAMTRQHALELGPYGIRVNAVAPGFISVDRTISKTPLEAREALLSRTASTRLGVPEDVAALVVYLCLPAAEYVSGQIFRVDGGLSCRMG